MQYSALITGASSGLGAETAKIFKSRNCRVYGTSRKRESGEVADGITWIKLDLLVPESIEEACSYIQKNIPHLNCIIHNAGIGFLGAAMDSKSAAFQQLFQTNVSGVAHFNAGLSKYILAHKPKLLFVSSIAGTFGLNYRAAYVASKHALEGYAKSLRMELKESGVTVQLVSPGDVKTKIANSRLVLEPKPGSPFHLPFNRVVKKIDEEVKAGLKPEEVAKEIFKIAINGGKRFKYIIAKPLQKLSILLYHAVPYGWFENLVIRHYNQ
ncbi:MAG: SDR family NAD(P)-dependent oxidoreductase [Luteibaculum sp.]